MVSKNRKRLVITLTSVFAALCILFGYYALAVTNFKSYGTSALVNEEEKTISFETDSMKILQLSDVQTSNLVESAIAYPTVERVIKKTEPDLIVLTGDNISNNSSKSVLNTFISFMDSFEIPWALVFGNHDIRSAVSPEEQCKAYESSKFCLFKEGNIEERYGNYYYKINHGGDTVFSLIFMDSADNSFTATQVDWYEDTVAKIGGENGGTVPSFVFFHIPIAETYDAHKAYESDSSIGSGRQVDEIRTQSRDTSFFDTLLALGSTKALFFGHDHRNNTFINYMGVEFCYGTKTGRTVYYERDSLGGNLITLYKNATFTVERVNV